MCCILIGVMLVGVAYGMDMAGDGYKRRAAFCYFTGFALALIGSIH